jgi:ADP-dependent NAD(P)H-hydrate dehydratase / NAD(P)H-hydrate epimerase
MARAGRAAFDSLLQHWPRARAVTVCCGKGNNAGDGYVLAALARAAGLGVELLQLGDPAQLAGAAAQARDQAVAAGVAIVMDWPEAPAGDVLVDALLGTGLRGPLAPAFADAVRWINAAGRPVLALDLPTGVDADTGAVTDPAVRAAVTVMFIGRKLGLYTGPGVSFAGRREFVELGVTAGVYRQVPGCPLLDYATLGPARRLPPRDPGAYKQSFGHLVVVGGDASMGGAPLMAAEAALRVGAGLVSVITRAAHRPAIIARRPELMVVDADDAFARAAALERATCLVIGPGLGREPWGEALLREALALGKPTVLDADGLQGLAALGLVPSGPIVGTPHPGEAAALLRSSTAAVQADRPGAVLALAARLGGVAVLKGAGTLIAAAGAAPGQAAQLLGVCAHGNPGMASAGMGDVLSGVIGSLLAQGLGPTDAAVAGVCLHSLAADRAVARLGQRSLLATDLLEPIIAILAEESAAESGAESADRAEARSP